MLTSRSFLILSCLLMATALPQSLRSQQPPATGINFKVLYSPPANGIGGIPGIIFESTKGLFYGPTESTYGSTIFNIDTGGQFKTVYQFGAGSLASGLIQAENGVLYGHGGNTVGTDYFSMNADGSNVKTYLTGKLGGVGSFAIPTPTGYLYDLMGQSPNLNLARIDLKGNITIVYQFNPAVGVPYSSLVQDAHGNFYGVAIPQPGGGSLGSVFRLSPTLQYTQLATFDISLLAGSGAALMIGHDGNLYGALAGGGKYRRGSIYRVTPQGQMTTLFEFPRNGIAGPTYLVEASDGYIYGSTYQNPTYLFRFNPAAPQLTPFYQMSGAEGIGAYFIQGSDGKFYGNSPDGGASGWGSLFTFDLGLTPPKPFLSLFSPTAGAPGTKILLWGRNLLGATSVTFNGTLATNVTGTTAYSVYITVPAGATSGPITIATPNGSYTTTGSFTVQ